MDPEKLPVERILFGVMLALAVWLGVGALRYRPANPDAPGLNTPQYQLADPVATPTAARHLAPPPGAWTDPFGPAFVVAGRDNPRENLRTLFGWERVSIITPPSVKPPIDEENPPPVDDGFVYIPVAAPPTAPTAGAPTPQDNGEDDEGDEPEPEFAGAVVAVRRVGGAWTAVVRPNSWGDPFDQITVRAGMTWLFDGEKYTIVSIDWDRVRIRYADGRERDIELDALAAAAAPTKPAGGGRP